jgi:hypothetical protein
MEALAVNQILVKLLLLALNLMPLDQAGFNFHIAGDGHYVTTYRVERRDQDFTVFRPVTEDENFPAFDAERSRRFGRTYMVRVRETGEVFSVALTDIMMDMPPLSSTPRQILKMGSAGVSTAAGSTAEALAAGTSAGEDEAAAGKSGAVSTGDGAAGDIHIDGVGRTLFLSMEGREGQTGQEGQNLIIIVEINAPL